MSDKNTMSDEELLKWSLNMSELLNKALHDRLAAVAQAERRERESAEEAEQRRANGEGTISPWMPMTDPQALARLGKLVEELGEAVKASGRAIIQGASEKSLHKTLTNVQVLNEELDDVAATASMVREYFELTASEERWENKRTGFRQWFGMIKDRQPGMAKLVSRSSMRPALLPMSDPRCRDGRFITLYIKSGCTTTPLRAVVCRYYPQYRPEQPWITHANESIFDDGGSSEDMVGWVPVPFVVEEVEPE